MINRRNFLRSSLLTTAGIAATGLGFARTGSKTSARKTRTMLNERPPIEKRNFVSDAVEAKIQEMKIRISDAELTHLFENCFPNTLDTTVFLDTVNGRPDTFVITGDIEAMWLRDSSAQVWPYIPLAKEDPKLASLIEGVINRHSRSILLDPYANAFNRGSEESKEWTKDYTDMKPGLWERKWEVDSLCYPIRLAHGFWKATGITTCFHSEWLNAMKLVVKTFKEQQRKNDLGPYKFRRTTTIWNDTLPIQGTGMKTKKVGMIHSMFRPSDDCCIFPFLIPSNLFAVVSLRQAAEMAQDILGEKVFAEECRSLANEVEDAVQEYARIVIPPFGEVYVFEVDGFGSRLINDDANVPNLLSLPYLGVCSPDDPVYKNTRKMLLSENNPYFNKGKFAEGLGSFHTPPRYAWHLGITMRGLTTTDKTEIAQQVEMLKNSHGGTYFMHESFDCDAPEKFTRSWFAWANTLFGEFILKVYGK